VSSDDPAPPPVRQEAAQQVATNARPAAPGGAPSVGPEGFDAVAEARRLARCARSGALAVHGADGFPFSSLVNVAMDVNGAPILLLSELAVHTQRLMADPRAALLLTQAGKGDPLAHPRVTLIGEARRCRRSRDDPSETDRLRLRFLARHPKSALYADFSDFSFWTVRLRGVHLNGGFARAASIEPDHFLLPLDGADDLIARQADILERVNREHAAELAICAERRAKGGPRARNRRWRAVGVDPEGLDLLGGEEAARLVLPARARGGADLLRMIAELAEGGAGGPDACLEKGAVRQLNSNVDRKNT